MTDNPLRAAAQRVVDAVEGMDVSLPVGGDEVRDSLIALRAALASAPAEGPPPPDYDLMGTDYGVPVKRPAAAPALDVDIVERVLAERWCGADSHDHEMQSEHREDAEMFVREYAALAPVPDEGPLREAAHKLSWAVLNHLSGHTLEDFAHQLDAALASVPAEGPHITSTDQLEAEQRGLPIPFARPAAAPALDEEQLRAAVTRVELVDEMVGVVGRGSFIDRVIAEYNLPGSTYTDPKG